MNEPWRVVREIFAAQQCPAECPFLAQVQEYHPPYLGDGPECWTECTATRDEMCPVLMEQENETL